MTASVHAEWLKSLGTQRQDLPAIRRLKPVSHTVTYPGNVTTGTLTGAIKASPNTEAELVTFTIGTASYDAGTDKTSWVVSLTGTQTNGTNLPISGDGSAVDYFVFDFLFQPSGGDVGLLFGGLVEVTGFVTEPA